MTADVRQRIRGEINTRARLTLGIHPTDTCGRGTVGSYRKGCRCGACRDASASAKRARRSRRREATL